MVAVLCFGGGGVPSLPFGRNQVFSSVNTHFYCLANQSRGHGGRGAGGGGGLPQLPRRHIVCVLCHSGPHFVVELSRLCSDCAPPNAGTVLVAVCAIGNALVVTRQTFPAEVPERALSVAVAVSVNCGGPMPAAELGASDPLCRNTVRVLHVYPP
jgi:hypothetical protein